MTDKPLPRGHPQDALGDVVCDGPLGHQASVPPVRGYHGDVLLHGIQRGSGGDDLTVQSDGATVEALQTEQHLQYSLVATACQTGQTHHTAGAYLEGYVLHRVAHGQVLHVQHHVAPLSGAAGVDARGVVTQHQGDDLVHIGVRGVQGLNVPSVPHNGDAIGDLEHLVHAVGDVQDGHALGGLLADKAEQYLCLIHIQGGVGLVQNKYLRVVGDSPGDLYPLPLADGQQFHGGVQINVQFHLVQHLLGAAAHLFVVQGQPLSQLLAGENIHLRGLQGEHGQLLEHDAHARPAGVGGILGVVYLPV